MTPLRLAPFSYNNAIQAAVIVYCGYVGMGYLTDQTDQEGWSIQKGIALLIICSAAMAAIPFFVNSRALDIINFAISATGLIVSVFGFGFTLIQLKKTKGAAQAAELATEKIKTGLGSLDALAEFQQARAGIESAQLELTDKLWSRARPSCNRVRQSLNRIVAMSDQLTADEIEVMKDSIADTHRIIGELQGAGADQNDFNYQELSNKLTEMDSLCVQIETKVRGRFSV